MNRGSKIFRLVFSIVLAVGFAFIALYLLKKQTKDYSFLSFDVAEVESSVLINDVDRLLNKYRSGSEHQIEDLPSDVQTAIDFLSQHPNFLFNTYFANRLFVSWNADGYILVARNAELSVDYIGGILNDELGVSATVNESGITIGGSSLDFSSHGRFSVLSTVPYTVDENALPEPKGNTDFVVFKNDTDYVSHILTEAYHFELEQTKNKDLKGHPISHLPFFAKLPAQFDEIQFAGSSRFQDDVPALYPNAPEENFAWMDDGFLVLKKDTFEILISLQNQSRNLKLILEEQTLNAKTDSSQIDYFNIGNFEIMPFEVDENWDKSIPFLDSPLHYYTEYDNFNILANSVSALRWYLAEFQLGRFFLKDETLAEIYNQTLPARVNFLTLANSGEEEQVQVFSASRSDQKMIFTNVFINQQPIVGGESELLANFPVEIIPGRISYIQTNAGKELLLNNLNQLVLYSMDGEKRWRLDLSINLSAPPQIVDFEKDGKNEIVLFQNNQLDVINQNGKSLTGFPVDIGNGSAGGVALNYDNQYNYRLLVHTASTIACYDESGKKVNGWMFKNMDSGLKGTINYSQLGGKDFICFEDKDHNYYRINRRGEDRFNVPVKFKLKNETPFLLGTNENSLCKMGYDNQYIYTQYLRDGQQDSVKLDERVLPNSVRWKKQNGEPLLIIDENDRMLVFDKFGYVKTEIIKESAQQELVEVFDSQGFLYLFFDSRQNKLYLRDRGGKLRTSKPLNGATPVMLDGDQLTTFFANKIKVYKLN